jgi:hypothetical protein
MPEGSYCVLDAADVQKMFSDMQARMKRAVLRRALVAAINVIADEVRQACPDVTGVMQASLGTKVSTSSDGLKGSARIVWNNDQGVVVARVEFGHTNVGHQPELKNLGSVTPPHPFFWNACDRALPKALEVYTLMVESEVIAREGL